MNITTPHAATVAPTSSVSSVETVAKAIEGLGSNEKGYWPEERGWHSKDSSKIFQYPAMMVPAMQAAIIDIIQGADPTIERVLDPFVGSGTVLAESVWRGWDFGGQDVNPLAYLLCRQRTDPRFPKALREKSEGLLRRIKDDKSTAIDHEYLHHPKWFKEGVRRQLCRIRRQITAEPAPWARRFYWTVLAETVRRSSNSRMSTVKLHAMNEEMLARHNPNVVGIFATQIATALNAYEENFRELKIASQLNKGNIRSNIKLHLGDTREDVGCKFDEKFDLLVTSPPYGDNPTTVPYGQASYLPLSWIDPKDIHNDLDYDKVLDSTNSIDRQSLGGRRKDWREKRDDLLGKYSVMQDEFQRLSAFPQDRSARVASFMYDFDQALNQITNSMRPDGWMVWTVGNRFVGGNAVPFDETLKAMLDRQGFDLVEQCVRTIKRKRHAKRNSVGQTMTKETIIVAKGR